MSTQYYIRLPGRPWQPAEPHHIAGLETYLSLRQEGKKGSSLLIGTPRSDGSHFMARYWKKNAAIYTFQEEDVEMDIMKCAIVLPCTTRIKESDQKE